MKICHSILPFNYCIVIFLTFSVPAINFNGQCVKTMFCCLSLMAEPPAALRPHNGPPVFVVDWDFWNNSLSLL